MKLSGLTVSIVSTFMLVLCGSLALGLFVTVVFWQRSLVQAETERAVLVLRQMGYLLQGDLGQGEDRFGEDTLRSFVDGGGYSLSAVVYYNGRTVASYPESGETSSLEQLVRSSGMTGQEMVTYRGSVWATLSPGRKTVLVARPIAVDGVSHAAMGAVVELLPLYRHFRDEVRLVVFYMVVNIIIFSVIGLYRMWGLAVTPIERMARVSESYTVSGGTPFVGDDTGSEFGRLSVALNSMLLRIELDRDELSRTVESLAAANEELRQAQREMVQAEKFAAVGRLSAGLAHEIGNPLGIVQGYVELLRQTDLSADDRRQFAERALGELQRIDRLIRRLLDFARTKPRQHVVFRVGEILEELQDMFAAQARRAGIDLRVGVDGDDSVRGDRDGLKQVLLNCLLNSFDAIESGGRSGDGVVAVEVREEEKTGAKRWLTIIVSDNGSGVDTADSSLLFEPFYTTKEPGKGTGLGLSVSQAIVEAHGGRMHLDGEKGRGATVTIDLPAAQADGRQTGGA